MRLRYLLLFILLFSCCTGFDPDYSRIRISEVVDGDTLILENAKSLRLIGIDTPEVRRKDATGFVYDPMPFSLEAKAFVEESVKGKVCRIEFDIAKIDKYGRLLGYCFISQDGQEVFLNAELLKEGYAVLYTYPPNIKYVEEFVASQSLARSQAKGLWGGYEVISPEDTPEFIGQIRRVRGRVLSTYNSGKAVFLNFGNDYKTDFSVVIFKNSFEYFEARRIRPEIFYKGRVVEVVGRIREYNGPEIIVNIPQEIEIVD